MKTAIYIEDGTVQLVITPETDFEKDAMRMFGNEPLDAKMFRGAFYDCPGGWVRQKPNYGSLTPVGAGRTNADDSLILRMSKPAVHAQMGQTYATPTEPT